jgi:hypothetical protein
MISGWEESQLFERIRSWAAGRASLSVYSIQRSETASSVGDIGSPSLLSYLSHPGWALA